VVQSTLPCPFTREEASSGPPKKREAESPLPEEERLRHPMRCALLFWVWARQKCDRFRSTHDGLSPRRTSAQANARSVRKDG